MNTKVEQVVKAILAAPDEIGDVAREANEFYFRFRGHVFSIQKRHGLPRIATAGEFPEEDPGRYSFYVYPSWDGSPEGLAYTESRTDQDVESISYGADYCDQRLLSRLHKEAMSRCFNVDAVFDDILGNTAS